MSSVIEPAGMMKKSYRRQKSQVSYLVLTTLMSEKAEDLVWTKKVTSVVWIAEIMGEAGDEKVVEHKC